LPQHVLIPYLMSKLTDSSTLIDCRPADCYAEYAPLGGINVPYDELLLHPEKYLEAEKAYYLICENGALSLRAAMILELNGYKNQVANVFGGYEAYRASTESKKKR